MTVTQIVLLFAAATIAGALNSVAGGGSFISFPALMQIGHIAPVQANATNTVALWPGSVASVFAYRREFAAQKALLPGLGLISLIGGVLGAVLLVKTPDRTFLMLVPWLLLGATLLFAFGGHITRWAQARTATGGRSRPWWSYTCFFGLQLLIATYGGYFGGGIGMLMLALLSVIGLEEIHAMNALKTVFASCINGVAVITFIYYAKVVWPAALLMVAGAIVGGYAGAHYAMKLPKEWVRAFVLCVGFGMAAYFFVRGA